MKLKMFVLIITSFVAVVCNGQGTTKKPIESSKIESGTAKLSATTGPGSVTDTAELRKMQEEWNKYADTLVSKTTVKDFMKWFTQNLSKEQYDGEFSKGFGPYYDAWLRSMYAQWAQRRQQPKK